MPGDFLARRDVVPRAIAAQPGANKSPPRVQDGPLAAVAKSAARSVISFRMVRKAFFGCSIGSTGFFLMMETSSMASVTFRARDLRRSRPS